MNICDDIGAAREQYSAGSRADESLDAVIDCVDGGEYLRATIFDDQQDGNQADGPPTAHGIIGRLQLNKRITHGEPGGQRHQ